VNDVEVKPVPVNVHCITIEVMLFEVSDSTGATTAIEGIKTVSGLE